MISEIPLMNFGKKHFVMLLFLRVFLRRDEPRDDRHFRSSQKKFFGIQCLIAQDASCCVAGDNIGESTGRSLRNSWCSSKFGVGIGDHSGTFPNSGCEHDGNGDGDGGPASPVAFGCSSSSFSSSSSASPEN